ncbi:Procollagen galactosyltransferase 2 [Dimargaris verticillata]|uniref:Procollagen galactosyltransferase 2 n=1 Tax=Dimargaris verticillata TaxID=2761393 RepID=A0A9W8ECR1_9FUNG|nr:Procollagen galactosyltransferase 2 [Dimargaris verticillata]
MGEVERLYAAEEGGILSSEATKRSQRQRPKQWLSCRGLVVGLFCTWLILTAGFFYYARGSSPTSATSTRKTTTQDPAENANEPQPNVVAPAIVEKIVHVTETVTMVATPTATAEAQQELPLTKPEVASLKDFGAYPMGFDRTYIINLASRTDRREKMQAMADFLRLDVTFLEATDKEAVRADPKLWPPERSWMRDSQIACWKSHMRIYEAMEQDPTLETVLILEDDIDIDYDFAYKAQLALDALRKEQWDMLYLGHCSGFEGKADKLVNQTANLFHAAYPVCSHGYAITRQGAKKLQQKLAKPLGPFDLMVVGLNEHHSANIFSIQPPLITQYHFQGDTSDINTDGHNGMTGGPVSISTRERLHLYYQQTHTD